MWDPLLRQMGRGLGVAVQWGRGLGVAVQWDRGLGVAVQWRRGLGGMQGRHIVQSGRELLVETHTNSEWEQPG